jgi:PAS domain S-box-containing protein
VSSTAQYQFAAEFVTFLACAAGLAVVVLRSELITRTWWAQWFLTAGFLVLGSAAFMHGALLGVSDSVVFALRGAGIVALAAGTMDWHGPAAARRMLWVGLGAAASSLAIASTTADSGANLALGLGAVGIGASVLSVSRRSIAARVAASAALVLLLVILVLSLALSTVISSTVRDEALRRLGERAAVESSLIENRTADAKSAARLVAVSLQSAAAPELLKLYADPQRSAVIDDSLRTLSTNFLGGVPLAYLNFDRRVLAATQLDQREVTDLAASDIVTEAIRLQREVGTPAPIGNRAVVVGVAPVLYIPSPKEARLPLGLVVASFVLDDNYLTVRSSDNTGLSVALATNTRTLATFGRQPPSAATTALVRRVLEDGQPAVTTAGGRFMAAQPVMEGSNDAAHAAPGRPVFALVAATPTTVVDKTRDDLYRTLFFIALGGTLLALLLAAVVGERIGSSVRRLTIAAGAIQRGQLNVRADVVSEDEVGVLGATFDSMAASIEEKTGALRQAADEEAALRDRLEAVVAGMGEALVAVDAEGRITDFNQEAEELTGWSVVEARGKDAARVLPMRTETGIELGPRLRKPLIRRWTAVALLTSRESGVIPVAVSAGALRGTEGELAGGVFVLRDLRGEREVERMKTEFLSHIGHELRTPLAGVIGFTEILSRRELPPSKAREVQKDILLSAHQLGRIVEMLEFFATTSAGRSPLRPEPLDVRAVVDDVVSRWAGRLNGQHPITRRVARGLPEVVADRRWLAKSVDELIDNAVKFSPDGTRITVTAEPATNGRTAGIGISVADLGKGMTPEEHERAFSDFIQGDGSDTRSYGGLGLGLAMVKRVAEAHGGHVDVATEPDRGSKFSIFLPAAPKASRQRRRS